MGVSVSPSTVRRTLLDAGLDPAPRRGSGPSWREFLQAQAASIVACDFFTVESLFLRRYYALFFIAHGSRRVWLAGRTANPTSAWVTQQARNLGLDFSDKGVRFLIRDRDRRTQQRLRWHLHALDPTFVVPLRMLGRSSHLERVSRWLARQEHQMQVRLARELVSRCRSLNRTIAELDQELEQRATAIAPALLELPGCAGVTAAKLLAEIGPVDRFKSDAQLARHSGVAPLEASSGRTQRHRLDRGGNRQLNAALYRIAITQSRYHPAARAYLERKRAEGKSRREAIRCLKRLLIRVIFNTLKTSPTLT